MKELEALEHTRHSYIKTIELEAKRDGWRDEDLQNVINVITRDLDLIQQTLEKYRFLQDKLDKIDETLYNDNALKEIQQIVEV